MLHGIINFGAYSGHIAMLLLRLGLGFVFLVHGFSKIKDIPGTQEGFKSMGIPAPNFVAIYTSLVEFLGAIALIVGIFTGWTSILLISVMLGAIFFVNLSEGFAGGWEFDLILLIMALSVLLMGPGKYSLSWYLFNLM